MLPLIAAVSIVNAIEAERAFAADAHAVGQWTAFRKWSHEDAVMFTPRPVWAHELLKDQPDPPKALDWAPAESWVSCDGKTAVNRGPWSSPSGQAHGHFTTVWTRSADGWRWVYDGGEKLSAPMPLPEQPHVRRAECSGLARIRPAPSAREVSRRAGGNGPAAAGEGRSPDGTLIYQWSAAPDGTRRFVAKLWDGRAYRVALDEKVAAPAP